MSIYTGEDLYHLVYNDIITLEMLSLSDYEKYSEYEAQLELSENQRLVALEEQFWAEYNGIQEDGHSQADEEAFYAQQLNQN